MCGQGRRPRVPVVLPDGRQSFVEVATVQNFLAYPASLHRTKRRYRTSAATWDSMRRMRDLARQRGIALTFVISPMHAEACELEISAGPETPTRRAVDWRIGHRIGVPAPLRGRALRYTVRLRATAPVALSAGRVYVHDAAGTTAVPVPLVTQDWRAVTVEHVVAPEASTVEFWFQLVSGKGTISPAGQRIYFTTMVDQIGPASRARRGGAGGWVSSPRYR